MSCVYPYLPGKDACCYSYIRVHHACTEYPYKPVCFVSYMLHTPCRGQAVDPFGPRADGDDVFCCQSRLLDRTMLGDAQHLAWLRLACCTSQSAAPVAHRHYPCHTDSDLLPCRTVLCNSTLSLESTPVMPPTRGWSGYRIRQAAATEYRHVPVLYVPRTRTT